MSDPSYLLATLRTAGYSVRAADGKLLIAPASRLPAGWREEIAEYRAELIDLVTNEDTDRLARTAGRRVNGTVTYLTGEWP